MIIPKPKDAVHKAWLYRLLIKLLDEPIISQNIYFKGGTCAAILGWLDRFSIDLDFDLKAGVKKDKLRPVFHKQFKELGLRVKDESKKALQFFLKYPAKAGQRSTIKLDIIDKVYSNSQYEPNYLMEIDRYAICQTQSTMFSHKLLAVEDRYKRFKSVAGRDIYDIHHFFLWGYQYNSKLIKERSGKKSKTYLKWLKDFVQKKVTNTIIQEDLNTLLAPDKFQAIRKTLKQEVIVFLLDELKRLS